MWNALPVRPGEVPLHDAARAHVDLLKQQYAWVTWSDTLGPEWLYLEGPSIDATLAILL